MARTTPPRPFDIVDVRSPVLDRHAVITHGMLDPVIVEFAAELWVWAARKTETWTFVSLPADESDEILDLTAGRRRGFGSVRVRAGIGTSTWTTSIFPDSKRGAYVLPVKKAVRTKERLNPGDVASVRVELIDD